MLDLHRAVGDLEALPGAERRLFSSPGFDPKRVPDTGDWLAQHSESGQTFAQFTATRPNRPDATRKVIYIQPLGHFDPTDGAPDLAILERYAAAFFTGLPVVVQAPLALDGEAIRERRNPASPAPDGRQLLSTDVLRLLARDLPDDAFCRVAISMLDLYPESSWNFVFGQASLRERVGVFSFARYADDNTALTLRRSLNVMTHEIGHMFGMRHCIFFECLMNGSNHLAEADRRPLHLCPIDLHKLVASIGPERLDLEVRYRRLQALCDDLGFADEARWIAAQLAKPLEHDGHWRARPGL